MSRSNLIKWLGCGGALLLVGFACAATVFRKEWFPTPQERMRAGVQATLDRLAEAYNEGKPELLDEVFDPDNPGFKRMAKAVFDLQEDSFFGEEAFYRFTATSYQPTELGYVLVNVRVNGNWATFWYFREAEGRWWLSEPTPDQLGEPQTIETEHFRLTYYPWSEDILPLLTETLEASYTQTIDVLGQAPTTKSEVAVMPLSELVSLRYRSVLGLYIPEKDSDPPTGKIVVVSPHTYLASPYALALGWKPVLTDLLAHEYTHLVHHQVFLGEGWTIDWVVEGLAEYVANDEDALHTICYAVEQDFAVPIWNPADPDQADLVHLTGLDKDVALAYSLAHLLVIHTVETYGGLDAVWDLAEAHERNPRNFGRSVQSALDVSYEEFDEGWLAWVDERCNGGYYHAP